MRLTTRFFLFATCLAICIVSCNNTPSSGENKSIAKVSVAETDTALSHSTSAVTTDTTVILEPIDTADFNMRMKQISNNDSSGRWPVKSPYPLPGALLPYNRIIAFYGNLYSTRMGILGELPKKQMLEKLQQEVAKWGAADSSVKTIPALHYIAVTAQGAGGSSKNYRLRMPFKQIDTVMLWAKEIDALVFLDIQIGHSTLQQEIPELSKYLSQPGVHLGIDPEFALKAGNVPGSKIGTFDASEINYAIDFLAELVRKNNLPPKLLVIHRFTQGMITNYQMIKKVPEVQIVIDMDGWGNKTLKKSTWLRYIYREPIQFTGFKIFYKNDLKKNSTGLYQPDELLKFTPRPMYIQYQ